MVEYISEKGEWKEKKPEPKRILVTGAGGFIGSHLARYLHNEGNFVRAVDIKWDDYIKEKYWSERFTWDLRNGSNANSAVQDIDWVFHLAANMGGIGHITSVHGQIMYDNNLMDAYIVGACVTNKVKRLFYSSSACVYPVELQTTTKIKPLSEYEAYPANPDSSYGWQKLCTEQLLEAFHKDYGLNIRIARYHNIYGPQGTFDGGKEKAPAALCRKVALAKDRDTIEIWGDGKQTRSFCYITDCVEGTMKLMESNVTTPVNIGSDYFITIEGLANMAIRCSGKTLVKKYLENKPVGVRGRNADLSLAWMKLKWRPRIRLDEGIMETYKWIKGQVSLSSANQK